MKNETIKIRINDKLKKSFKSKCKTDNWTMSDKIIDLIEQDISKNKSLKTTLVKELIHNFLNNIIFETLEIGENLLKDELNKHFSFETIVSDFEIIKHKTIGNVYFKDGGGECCITFVIINTGIIVD